MKRIYEQFKNYKVNYGDDVVTIVGFTDEHLIGAVHGSKDYTFKKPRYEHYIDPDYTHVSYRFCYVNESTVLKQMKEEGNTNSLKIEDLEVKL